MTASTTFPTICTRCSRAAERLLIAEQLGEEILTLPLFYEMTDEQVETVIATVPLLLAVTGRCRGVDRPDARGSPHF
jgi:dTDP-4-amino-4,6-dideoxygalactose transaminase